MSNLINDIVIFQANNWGCDDDGTCGLGHGPQEEFWGCSDITIRAGNGPRPTQPRPTTARPSLTTGAPVPQVTTRRTTTAAPATQPPPTGQRVCRGHGDFTGSVFDTYCNTNCNNLPPFCPGTVCICDN